MKVIIDNKIFWMQEVLNCSFLITNLFTCSKFYDKKYAMFIFIFGVYSKGSYVQIIFKHLYGVFNVVIFRLENV